MARTITCTNNNGYTVEFGEERFSPFILAHVDGIYGFLNNVVITNNTMSDGGTYQGSTAKPRDIVLTVMGKPNVLFRNGQSDRDLLYSLFEKDTLGTFTYKENGVERTIRYRVEKVTVGSAKKRLYMISLVCEDPYFYEKNSHAVNLSAVISAFEFEHEFVAAGEEISYISPQRIATIDNDNAVGGIGLTITVKTRGTVENPKLTLVETDESMELGSTAKPLVMSARDVLTITTGTNNKHVYLESDGVTTEVNEYMTEDSVFFQLQRGANNIGYSAEVGEENMDVSIEYRFKYQGV